MKIHDGWTFVDPNLIKQSILKRDDFPQLFPSNTKFSSVTEVTHAFSNEKQLIFDERTRAYKKMVDFRGVANKLSLQVVDCLKTSELNPDKSANIDPLTADQPKKSNDYVSNASGLRWIEDVVRGKRNDRSFRMVIVGDPNLHLHEIGMLCHIAERLQDSESLTAWNWEKLSACFENDVFLSSFELQQLHMFHPVRFLLPAVKSPSANACVWTGKQLISLLRPVGFDHDFPSSDVCIRNVDLVYSEGSFWLRDTDRNLFQSLGRYCHGQVLDSLYAAQRVLNM